MPYTHIHSITLHEIPSDDLKWPTVHLLPHLDVVSRPVTLLMFITPCRFQLIMNTTSHRFLLRFLASVSVGQSTLPAATAHVWPQARSTIFELRWSDWTRSAFTRGGIWILDAALQNTSRENNKAFEYSCPSAIFLDSLQLFIRLSSEGGAWENFYFLLFASSEEEQSKTCNHKTIRIKHFLSDKMQFAVGVRVSLWADSPKSLTSKTRSYHRKRNMLPF